MSSLHHLNGLSSASAGGAVPPGRGPGGSSGRSSHVRGAVGRANAAVAGADVPLSQRIRVVQPGEEGSDSEGAAVRLPGSSRASRRNLAFGDWGQRSRNGRVSGGARQPAGNVSGSASRASSASGVDSAPSSSRVGGSGSADAGGAVQAQGSSRSADQKEVPKNVYTLISDVFRFVTSPPVIAGLAAQYLVGYKPLSVVCGLMALQPVCALVKGVAEGCFSRKKPQEIAAVKQKLAQTNNDKARLERELVKLEDLAQCEENTARIQRGKRPLPLPSASSQAVSVSAVRDQLGEILLADRLVSVGMPEDQANDFIEQHKEAMADMLARGLTQMQSQADFVSNIGQIQQAQKALNEARNGAQIGYFPSSES